MMIAIAYWTQLACLLATLMGAAYACWMAWGSVSTVADNARLAEDDGATAANLEWLQGSIALLLTLAAAILFKAFAARDFSFKYVTEYSDTFLPIFYAITAFWAGQEGSLFLWAWVVAIMAALVPVTSGYRGLEPRARLFFWLFLLAIQAFMLLALCNWSNPFLELVPAPVEGRGLNPLLRNPGMIFHPPLLFIGYAAYTIPFCLGLAASAAGNRGAWLAAGRNWAIVAWIFLTAGIVLGGWWSYMELGWGGYWAWDPVENASLIPWLAGTAFLHTALVEERRGALGRTNVLLAGLTFTLCFFATYLVRSGVVQSLHAFGGGGISVPLLIFTMSGLVLTIVVLLLGPAGDGRALSGLVSRPGFLVLTAWLLLALGGIVLMGTMWPVISSLWSQKPIGLDATFYNRTCLPLFTGVAALLVVCPWLAWGEGFRSSRNFLMILGVVAMAAAGLAAIGITKPLALAAAAFAIAAMAGIVLLFATDKAVRAWRPSWGAWGVHLGVALMVLGVAFSGPYMREKEAVLTQGASLTLGKYTFTNNGFREDRSDAMEVVEADLAVSKDGKPVGKLNPQRRVYAHFEQQVFAEVAVIPSLGDELYATLLGITPEGSVSLKVSIHPLISWIWVGGTLMCLAGFLALRSGRNTRAS